MKSNSFVLCILYVLLFVLIDFCNFRLVSGSYSFERFWTVTFPIVKSLKYLNPIIIYRVAHC